MRFKTLSLSFLLLAAACCARAQELNCKVRVLHEKIQRTDPAVFTAMERAITDFMNNRRWTSDEFANTERIDCNILINLVTKGEDNPDLYTATISVQATRPVYNSSYTTPLINYIDRDFVFQYSQYTPMQFDDNRVNSGDAATSNLPAVLAYYAYIIIGLDYDSFSPAGGTNIFKKAQNVVNNAPDDGNKIPGWKAFEDKRNRYWIIDQLLSPRYTTFRSFWYSMHREGLDQMFSKPAEAKAKILAGIAILAQLQRENPGSSLLQFFFNAKSDEILRVMNGLSPDERKGYLTTLAQIDAANSSRYNNLK